MAGGTTEEFPMGINNKKVFWRRAPLIDLKIVLVVEISCKQPHARMKTTLIKPLAAKGGNSVDQTAFKYNLKS